MKFLLLIFFLLPGTTLWAEETKPSLFETASEAVDPPTERKQSPLDLCPDDMPPACACVTRGKGIRVMPAIEAYKNREEILLVGPRTRVTKP